MGGSGSHGGGYTEQNLDRDAIQNWISTTNEGSKYADTLQSIQGKGVYSSANGYAVGELNPPNGSAFQTPQVNGNVTNMLNDFAAWQSDQNNAQTAWNNYASLLAREGGGANQSTILDNGGQGQGMTPYQSILAAQQGPGVGNPALVTQINRNQKKVGAP